MAREYRVLSHLASHFPLVPRARHFSDDPSVLGAPFLIMEYRPGLVIGGTLPASFDSRTVGPHLSVTLVESLAALHAIDPDAVGLGAFGKPDGFLARAVAGWTKRADLGLGGADRPTAMRDVVRWLEATPTPAGGVTLLHNDFKLDNVVLDPETLSPSAILDWDMGSRGDPLFDVSTLLSYWCEAGDPPCMHRLAQMPTAEPGFWTRDQALAAYAEKTGRDVSDFQFYRVLCLFKLAVVFLQLDARAKAGGPLDPKMAAMTGIGHELMEFAATLL